MDVNADKSCVISDAHSDLVAELRELIRALFYSDFSEVLSDGRRRLRCRILRFESAAERDKNESLVRLSARFKHVSVDRLFIDIPRDLYDLFEAHLRLRPPQEKSVEFRRDIQFDPAVVQAG